jgi:hypothetical protein
MRRFCRFYKHDIHWRQACTIHSGNILISVNLSLSSCVLISAVLFLHNLNGQTAIDDHRGVEMSLRSLRSTFTHYLSVHPRHP